MSDRILGIDPGSRVTGYAVLEYENSYYKAVCCDTIPLAEIDDPLERLTRLYTAVTSVIDTHQPTCCAIETPVYGKDPVAMLKLGRAQAALIMAVLHKNISVHEYYPKAVKKAITGTGNARKDQVAYMLKKMIVLPEQKLSEDATDALAVAWCHYLKLSNPALKQDETTTMKSGSRKNTWSSYVENHPDRIRKT